MKAIASVLVGLAIAASPAIFTTVIWAVTFGSFDLVPTVQSDFIVAMSLITSIVGVGAGFAYYHDDL